MIDEDYIIEELKKLGYKKEEDTNSILSLRKVDGRDSVVYLKFWKGSQAYGKYQECADGICLAMIPISARENFLIENLIEIWQWDVN